MPVKSLQVVSQVSCILGLQIESEWHGIDFANYLCSEYNTMGSWSNLPPSLNQDIEQDWVIKNFRQWLLDLILRVFPCWAAVCWSPVCCYEQGQQMNGGTEVHNKQKTNKCYFYKLNILETFDASYLRIHIILTICVLFLFFFEREQ